MSKLKSLHVVVIALSIAMPLGVAGTAFAKHLTYAQAYARCKVHVDKLEASAQSQRYTRGAACMHMHGYRL